MLRTYLLAYLDSLGSLDRASYVSQVILALAQFTSRFAVGLRNL
jgi:hypothetical protein